jgi:excisionase family DNA binding protein
MKDVLTPKDLASAIGVSESSLRRWVDAGQLRTARTVGGHRRIPLAEAVRFIRDSRATVVRPELLGIPAPPPPPADAEDAPAPADPLYDALLAGDDARARGVLLSLYLTGASIPSLLDGPLAESLRRIGALYQHSPKGILLEHRATDIAIQILSHLRQLLPTTQPSAPSTQHSGTPLAMGGSPPGDVYLLPAQMAATTLLDAGYHVLNYGPDTPLDTLAAAAEDACPRLVYLSFTSAPAVDALPPDAINALAMRLWRAGAQLLLGGQQLPRLTLRPHPNVHPLRSMTALAAFARGLLPTRPTLPDMAEIATDENQIKGG